MRVIVSRSVVILATGRSGVALQAQEYIAGNFMRGRRWMSSNTTVSILNEK